MKGPIGPFFISGLNRPAALSPAIPKASLRSGARWQPPTEVRLEDKL